MLLEELIEQEVPGSLQQDGQSDGQPDPQEWI
jgi:hypothetical protein